MTAAIKSGRPATALLALAGLLLLAGCKKKSQPPPTPQAQAPTITTPAPPSTSAPSTQAQKPANTSATAKSTPATATKPKPRPRPPASVAKKTTPPVTATPPTTASATSPNPASTPPRIVVSEGGAPANNGQISAGMPHDEAVQHQQTTTQLLEATEANLRTVTRRSLKADEQDMVEQIRNYMQQSRNASAETDLVRAHNLALKAHLLSDELVKR